MSEFRNEIKSLYEFDRASTNGFNYVFEKHLEPHTVIYVKLPTISANKRGINDIAWMVDDEGCSLAGTISKNPLDEKKALWQPIQENHEINKVTSAIRITSGDNACNVVIRAILN